MPSNTRFATMLAAGALAEVQAMLDLGLDPALPTMRAHGVPELAAHLRGGNLDRGGSAPGAADLPASAP